MNAPPPRLQRVTTRYDADEDRLCLSGVTASGEMHAIWLTQRLLLRVLPHLFAWLEAAPPVGAAAAGPQTVGAAVQAFSQQAAVAAQGRLAPVPRPHADAGWLVRGIGFSATGDEACLTFTSGPGGRGEALLLALASTPLRQWLGVVHSRWVVAGWPVAIWPAWMAPGAHASPGAGKGALH